MGESCKCLSCVSCVGITQRGNSSTKSTLTKNNKNTSRGPSAFLKKRKRESKSSNIPVFGCETRQQLCLGCCGTLSLPWKGRNKPQLKLPSRPGTEPILLQPPPNKKRKTRSLGASCAKRFTLCGAQEKQSLRSKIQLRSMGSENTAVSFQKSGTFNQPRGPLASAHCRITGRSRCTSSSGSPAWETEAAWSGTHTLRRVDTSSGRVVKRFDVYAYVCVYV